MPSKSFASETLKATKIVVTTFPFCRAGSAMLTHIQDAADNRKDDWLSQVGYNNPFCLKELK